MKKKDLHFNKIPDDPGVYLFRNVKKKILYVGKATSLRARVRSYFNSNIKSSRGALIVKMLEESNGVDWKTTDSVLEALILEANFIKKYQPPFNTREKDNKSFNYLVITKEDFPRVLVVRGRELLSSRATQKLDTIPKYIFGPFPNGNILKEALTVVRKIFPFRDKCIPSWKINDTNKKPCFNKQLGLCPGVCSGEIGKADYAKIISNIRLLFLGKKTKLIKKIEREMIRLAKEQKFEKAGELKRQIFALKHIKETSLIGAEYRISNGDVFGRIEAYDVAHISETAKVGVMVVLEDGKIKKSEYRKFNIRTEKKGDIVALEEVLRRRFNHNEWNLPNILVIDGGIAQKRITIKILDEYGYKIPIVNVVKNEKHKAGRLVGNEILIKKMEKEILLANMEAHRFAITFHRQKRRKTLV